jgi:hypothetical protein
MTSEIRSDKLKRGVGRPRSLTLETIVDAACEIGLDGIEMALVAQRLKTGVATLYSYVDGRDHLLKLVAERLAAGSVIADRGQSWQDLLRDHAAIASAIFESQPHLIANLIGRTRNAQTFEYSKNILTIMMARGFSEDEAIDLFIEVNQLVIGVAVCLQRRKVLGGMTADEQGRPIPLPVSFGDYHTTLDRIIAGEESARRR